MLSCGLGAEILSCVGGPRLAGSVHAAVLPTMGPRLQTGDCGLYLSCRHVLFNLHSSHSPSYFF